MIPPAWVQEAEADANRRRELAHVLDIPAITHILNEVAARHVAENCSTSHPDDIATAMYGAIESAVHTLEVMCDAGMVRWEGYR